MKFGKFEIYGGVFVVIAIVVALYFILHFTLEEEKLLEETKQLELRKEILILEQSDEINRSENNV